MDTMSHPDQPMRVLVVADRGDVRTVTRLALERDGRFLVVGEAADVEAGARLAGSAQPDAILLDLDHDAEVDLREEPSMEPLVAIRAASPTACVLAITAVASERVRGTVALLGGAGVLERCDLLAAGPVLAHVCGLRRRDRDNVRHFDRVPGGRLARMSSRSRLSA